MKTSTTEAPKQPDPLSILLIGPPGGGKSTLMLQFPGLYVLDCDENLDGPERFVRGRDKNLHYLYDRVRYGDDDKSLDLSKCYDRVMDKLALVKVDPDIKTVVVDSLTSVNEFIIQRILTLQRRSEMEARDWIPFKSHMLALINRLRGLGKTSIATVHESKLSEPDPKNIMNRVVVAYEPSVQGSIVDYFGGFFTDMFRCTAEAAPGGSVEFRLDVIRTQKSDLKNSLGMVQGFRVKTGESVFEKLKPYLNGRV